MQYKWQPLKLVRSII